MQIDYNGFDDSFDNSTIYDNSGPRYQPYPGRQPLNCIDVLGIEPDAIQDIEGATVMRDIRDGVGDVCRPCGIWCRGSAI